MPPTGEAPEGDRECDVAVVGAGLAGLTAARRLVQSGCSAIVLEARDRVGGRTLNQPVGDAEVVELGGQWVGPTQDRILALIDELGLSVYPTRGQGDNLLHYRGRLRRYRGTIPRINPVVLADVGRAIWRLDRMASQVPADRPWEARRAARWDGQTFQTWIRRNLRTRGGRALLTLGCESVWAVHPSDVSLLHILFYAHAAGGMDALLSTEGGAQQWRVAGGSQLVALRMADALGDRVELNAPVASIETDGAGVTLHTDRLTVRAQRVIVALAPALSTRIRFQPPLPALRDQLCQRYANGSVIKAMAVYPDPFWRRDGLSGHVTSDTGPVRLCFDNTPESGQPGVLLGFLEGAAARELGQLTSGARAQLVIDCFTRYFGQRAAEPEQYIEHDWSADEWTRGCYAGYLPPGGWTGHGAAWREPVGRVHWAGTETATEWNGYLDGAVRSGERAARDVLSRSGSRPAMEGAR